MEKIDQSKLAAEKEHLRRIAEQLYKLTQEAYAFHADGTCDYIPQDHEKPDSSLHELLDRLQHRNDLHSVEKLALDTPQARAFVEQRLLKTLNELGFHDEFAFLGAGADSLALSARHENSSIYRIVVKLTGDAMDKERPEMPFIVTPFYNEIVGEHEKIGRLRLSIEPMMLVLNQEDHPNLAEPVHEIMALGLQEYNLERQRAFGEEPCYFLSDLKLDNWAIPPVSMDAQGNYAMAPIAIDADAIGKNAQAYQYWSEHGDAFPGAPNIIHFSETLKQVNHTQEEVNIPSCNWYPTKNHCRPDYLSRFRIPEQLKAHVANKAFNVYERAPSPRSNASLLSHFIKLGYGHAEDPAATNQWMLPDDPKVDFRKIRDSRTPDAQWTVQRGGQQVKHDASQKRGR